MKDGRFFGELILLSAVAGGVAALIKFLAHNIFMWLVGVKPFYIMLTAYLIHGHHKVENISEYIFSEMGDIVIGGIFGVILGIWLYFSHTKYYYLIGLGYGLGIWFSSLAFGNLTKIIRDPMTDPMSLFAHLIAMMTFGVSFVFLAHVWKPLKDRINGGQSEEDKPRTLKFMPNLMPLPAKKLIRAKEPRKYKKPDKLIRLKRFI